MSLVHDLLVQHLPVRRRTTPRGWILFDGVCCHHRGHNPDKRMRGNIKLSENGIVGGNCYNCGFKFMFDGQHLSHNFELFLTWLGVDHSDIQRIRLELLKNQVDGAEATGATALRNLHSQWQPVELPPQSQPLQAWQDLGCDDARFLHVVKYLQSRGDAIAQGYDYWWSPHPQHHMCDRLILPFYHKHDIVGYTARYSQAQPPAGITRYYNSVIPQGFLFNQDIAQYHNRKFMILTEGPFDAIAVQGVAAMGSKLSDYQIHWLSQQDKHIVVLPDRTRSNQDLIDTALLFGWSVSFPDWENHIKDAAEACKAYGNIYTISSVLASRTTNPITIGVRRKMFVL
jgi:hypothetical protein